MQQTNDKLVHFIAFFVLAALAVKAHPVARPGQLVVALSLLGLSIEFVQSLPMINRNAETMDFVVELFAIVVALIMMSTISAFMGRKRKDVQTNREP